MELKLKIYTTYSEHWMRKDLDFIVDIVSGTPGVTSVVYDIESVDFKQPDMYIDGDDDQKITWAWFKKHLSNKARADGFNAICLHTNKSTKRRWGIEDWLGGFYYTDRNDDVFDFVVIANKGERARYYPFSEFTRIFLHELSHGFDHWQHEYPNAYTHFYDYELRAIDRVYKNEHDMRQWSTLFSMKNLLLAVRKLQEKLNARAVYPVDGFVSGVTQGWMIENPIYMSGYHNGLDVRAKVGTPVRAPHNGIAYLSGYSPDLGYYVFYKTTIEGNLRCYLIPHLSHAPDMRNYTKGETLGFIGNTGMSFGSHLHITSLNTVPRNVQEYVALVSSKDKVLRNTNDPYKEFRWLVDHVMI